VDKLSTQCVIAGGGPAGLICGYLLARAGVDVIVLEKHKDFLRDFRGDTIHPSTLELIGELSLLEKFLARPHDEVREVTAEIGDQRFVAGDFTQLPSRCKFMVQMPQWEFLDFIAAEAKTLSTFHLFMEAEVVELLARSRRIMGVLLGVRRDRRDFIALEHRAIALGVGRIAPHQRRFDAWRPLRRREIDGDDARVRVRRSHDARVEHAGAIDVERVFSAAPHLVRPVESLDVRADDRRLARPGELRIRRRR